jgi:hypothetical protein
MLIPSEGITAKSLPILINNEKTEVTLTVDLRVRAEAGISVESDFIPIPGVPDIGAGAGVGVFANIIELIARVGPTDNCTLQAVETFNVNVGADAQFGIDINSKTIGVAPTVSTTIFQGPEFTQCLVNLGLPLPTRTVPLPTGAPICQGGAPQPPVAISTIRASTASTTCTTAKAAVVTHAPAVYERSVHRRTGGDKNQLPSQKNSTTTAAIASGLTTTVLTVTACKVQAVNCPENQQSIVTFTSTLCATPTAASSGVCVRVTDASVLPKPSEPITQTYTPPTAITTSSRALNSTVRATSARTSTSARLLSPTGGAFFGGNATATLRGPEGTGVPGAVTTRPTVREGGANRYSSCSIVAAVGGIAAALFLL